MPKPANENRRNTTVGISKSLKQKIRQCAVEAKNRRGYEKDEEVLERIISYYLENNSVEAVPHPTFTPRI